MSNEINKQLFQRLVQPHFDRLYRLAFRLTGRKAEAEDLFQELLIKAYGKLDDLVAIDEPGSWLSRVMYNLFIELNQLDLALKQLSDEHRLIVLLHDAEGYKLEEIHKLIGIPVGTVKSRLHRARARLREILTETGTFS
jgi:RNA polymerase sigma-70 factor (ECF subfamily)